MENEQFQFVNNSGSVRYNKEEIPNINALITQFGELENKQFTSFKDLFTNLLQSAISSKQQLLQPPSDSTETILEENQEIITYSEKLQEGINSVITVIGYESRPVINELLSDLIEIAITPIEPAPTVEIEKEVIKEVEKPLGENEILLDLSANQKLTIEKIARWRSINGHDPKKQEVSTVLKCMVFNIGSLTNAHECYPTGLVESKKAKSLIQQQ